MLFQKFLTIFFMYSAFFFINSGCFEAIPTNMTLRQKNVSPKIMGGLDANIAQYPSIVGLMSNGQHICGGTIIGLTVILSAAHCFDTTNKDIKYSVRAGSSYRTKGGVIYPLKHYYIHKSYDSNTYDYDYAIGKTKKKFQRFQVASLVREPVPDHSTVTVCGWGATDVYAVYEQLQYAQVLIISREICRAWVRGYKISSRMLCTATSSGGVDTCTGDSGGPLYYGKMLAGVTSWGFSCGMKTPSISANVLAVVDWIRQFI